MRTLITAVLLASTVATPLLAQHQDKRPDRDQAQQDQQPKQKDHADRADRPDRANRPDRPANAPDRAPDVARPAQPARPDARPDMGDRRPDARRGDPGPDMNRDRDARRPDRFDDRRDDRDRDVRDRNDGWRGNDRDRPGYRGNYGVRPGVNGAWNRTWRNDRRYNWQAYRATNRYLFRGPRWYAPRGAYYRRFSVGLRFSPIFYGERYWIADPWTYRLPPAYGPYRWVRYYDDVALVDIRSGQIVDIIYDFFG